MIRVDGLCKRFGDLVAVDNVSFEIARGEIYGLLGPNGAGKTTTLSMITGLLKPDSGRVLFEGTDIAADPIGVKRELGVVPQDIALYEELSARENLNFWGGLYGLRGAELDRRVDAVLEQVGLSSRAKERVEKFSGGMKRRLNLSMGLVHEPKLVMMDEPTVGIDPQARSKILEIVRDIAGDGTSVLYTTHYLEEAETLCDRIGIMDHGKVLAEGGLDELKQLLGEGELVTVNGSFAVESVRQELEQMNGVTILSVEPERLVLSTVKNGRGAVELLGHLLDGSLDVDGVAIQPPSLNGLFLKLTGRELRD